MRLHLCDEVIGLANSLLETEQPGEVQTLVIRMRDCYMQQAQQIRHGRGQGRKQRKRKAIEKAKAELVDAKKRIGDMEKEKMKKRKKRK